MMKETCICDEYTKCRYCSQFRTPGCMGSIGIDHDNYKEELTISVYDIIRYCKRKIDCSKCYFVTHAGCAIGQPKYWRY